MDEQKKIEQELRESEEFLQNIFDGMQDGISILDKDLNIIRVNHGMQQMYDIELEGKKCFNTYQGRNSICPWCPSIKTLESGQKNSAIVPYPSEADPRGWIELTSFPLKQKEKGVIGVIEYVKDITERVIAEQKLKESEERYRELIELLPDMVFESDANFNLTYANSVAFKQFGYTHKDLKGGIHGSQLVAQGELEKLNNNLKAILNGDPLEPHEYLFKRKDGTTFWGISHNRAIFKEGNFMGLMGVVHDISNRKKAEEKLKESEEKFRSIAENSTTGIIIIQDDKIKYVNKAMTNINDFTIEEMMEWAPMVLMERIHPEDRQQAIEYLKKRQSGDPDLPPNSSYRVIAKSGKIKWVDSYSKSIIYQGKFADLAIVMEVSKQKKAQEKLKESAEKLQRIFDVIPDLYFTVSRDSTILDYSGNEEDLYIPPSEFIDKKLSDLMPPPIGEEVLKIISNVLTDKKSQIYE